MATYGTDLTTLTDAESGTWVELSNYSSGGAPAADGENYIQGQDCMSQTTSTKSGLVFSIAFDYGSDASGLFSAGDVILMWQFYAVGSNLETFANGGLRMGVFDSLTVGDIWAVGGRDFGRNPYGGWMNVAIDPAGTADYQDGGGSAGAWRYFASLPYTLAAISKGTPHAVDAIRYGRGEIYVTGTGGNFTDMATYNDYNDATNGYNRFGLFSYQSGSFLWKGLLSFGQSATSVTFSDSNKTILIDDTPAVYAGFNKIEVNNASSSVTLTNVSIKALGTTSPGAFEMVDNATVSMTGCLFQNMNTFVFDTNATIVSTTFNSCGVITHGGADFDSCIFQGYEGTSDTSYMVYDVAADPDGEMDNCDFTKGTASTHAITFGTSSPTTMTLRGISFSGYNASDSQTDSTLYFARTTGTVTVNLIGCSGNISYKSAGATIVLVVDPVTFLVTVKDIDTGSVIVGARVFVKVSNGTNFPYQASVSITSSGTTATVTHTSHGLSTNDWVYIIGANEDAYNGAYQITVTGTNTYTYTMTETASSPATGTITSTFVIFSHVTNASGQVSDSRTYTSDQLVNGWVRKADATPFYKSQPINDTVDNVNGLSLTVFLSKDE